MYTEFTLYTLHSDEIINVMKKQKEQSRDNGSMEHTKHMP
jgi:hypothetical protein